MRKLTGFSVSIALFLALAGCAGPRDRPPSPGQENPSAIAQPEERPPAPSLSFETFDGDTISLDQLKGQPVALNFWAVYCPACSNFAPVLQKVYENHKDEGLLVFGIGAGEQQKQLQEKADSLGITYPLAISAEAAGAFKVHAIPITFIIDREGRVAASLLGARDLETVERTVQAIL